MDALRTSLAVALLVVAAPAARTDAATRTWTGTGSNRLWSTDANWSGALVPSSGDDLVFPGDAASFPSNNDLEPDALYTSMSFTGHFDLTGHAVSLGAGGLHVNHPGHVFLNVPFKLAAPQTWAVSPSGDVYISGAVDLGSNAIDLVLGPSSSISFSRPVSRTADMTLRGGGSVHFTGAEDGLTSATGTLKILDATMRLGNAYPGEIDLDHIQGRLFLENGVSTGAVIANAGEISTPSAFQPVHSEGLQLAPSVTYRQSITDVSTVGYGQMIVSGP